MPTLDLIDHQSHINLTSKELLYSKVGVECMSYACLFAGGHFKSPWVDTSIVNYYPLIEMRIELAI